MSRWGLIRNLPKKTAHVIPLNDLREHDEDCNCWCHPTEDDEYDDLYIHNSMDGREKFESGERTPT